ncbi:hypothetical protein [Streptomyces collinus]|uniref:hypothetical protein n=1 Tax=Streptomyces collinus TaxID=42684 RepID=UPI0036C4E539
MSRTRTLDREVGYSERERAAPALTEAVTVLTDRFVPDDVYGTAAKHFDQGEPAHLIGLVTSSTARTA